ncbi:MAG TPA: DMT family transporter, partial [Sediminispirochaeta sp.]|nr:DMT family transporter [Sediminispirochaeta sp.]
LSLALLGGLFLALHFATWITSLSYTSVASSVLLVNTHPVLVFVFSRLVLKEGGSRGDSFYVLLTLLGSALLSWGDLTLGRQALLGDFLALLGAVSVAGYMLIGRVVRRNMGVARYTFIVYGSCALFLLLGLGLFSLPLGPYSGKDFALFFALAFFCTILGHGIYNWALRFVGPTFLSVNVLLEPVAAGVMAYFFFQEIPGGLNILGAAVVLLGIFGYSRGENKRRTMKNSS